MTNLEQLEQREARSDDADATASERLLDVTLRYASRRADELPCHLLRYLAHDVETKEMPPEARLLRPEPAARLARALGWSLACSWRGTPRARRSGVLARWLPGLWWIDRVHGLNVLSEFVAVLDGERAAPVLETVGELLLRMLADADADADADDHGGSGENGPGPENALFAGDLAAIGGLPVRAADDRWGILLQGVARHVELSAAYFGPSGVGRWLRLCRSETALRCAAAQPGIRRDPSLIATLLLHGGPREIAVALAALSHTDPSTPLRSAVARLTLDEPGLSRRRMAFLLARLDRLRRDEAELRDALLRRACEPSGSRATPAAPLSDETLSPLADAYLEAAVLESREPSPKRRCEAVARLLEHIRDHLGLPSDARSVRPDEHWGRAVADGLAVAARATRGGDLGALRQEVFRTLTDIERSLCAPCVCTSPAGVGEGDPHDPCGQRARLRTTCTVVLRLARRLPDSPWGQSFSLALYELALRLRTSHAPELATAPVHATLEPLLAAPGAPDPRDERQLAAVADFVRRWRALERGEGLALSRPETARSLRTEALGVAQARRG